MPVKFKEISKAVFAEENNAWLKAFHTSGLPLKMATIKLMIKKEIRSIWMFALWDTKNALTGAKIIEKNGKKERMIS